MRELTLDTPDTLTQITVTNYGDTRTGKSVFAATFPRPLIIGDTIERGWKSVLTMPDAMRFEPDVEPIVWGVEAMNDLSKMYGQMDALIASGRISSISFDAFSFYCDFFLSNIVRLQTKPDQRGAFGDLGRHLREVYTQLQQRRVNVIWNCLAKHPDIDDKGVLVAKGRPMIPGQQADKFSAGVDFLFYSRVETINKVDHYRIHTRNYGNYLAGHREGINADRLPDPFTGSYSDLITHLGYDADAIRAALPKLNGSAKPLNGGKPAVVAPVAKPAVATAPIVRPAAPPVIIRSQAPRGASK